MAVSMRPKYCSHQLPERGRPIESSEDLAALGTDCMVSLGISDRLNEEGIPYVLEERSLMIGTDSRRLLQVMKSSSADCIITSPPYGSLKRYGGGPQIGYGQDRDSEYLPDLLIVLRELFRIAKDGAALWLVLDMLKEDGKTVALPWEVASRAQEAGWAFQDLVIWDKGKSLPWSHSGRFRGVCEYVLLLSKGKLRTFNLDAVRESDNLSPYWIRFPERYHPDGKAPSDLWHFPIPIQGSWTKHGPHHSCPFPVGLVARMVQLTTQRGDLILDPFAGTGTVPAVSAYLERHGVGVEINGESLQDYEKHGAARLSDLCEIEIGRNDGAAGSLRQTIVSLRMLKYPRTLFTELSRVDRLSSEATRDIALMILSPHINIIDTTGDHSVLRMDLRVLLRENASADSISNQVRKISAVAPLSKFGLNVHTDLIEHDRWSRGDFGVTGGCGSWWVYRNGRFYNAAEEVAASELPRFLATEAAPTGRKIPAIVAPIHLALELPASDS